MTDEQQMRQLVGHLEMLGQQVQQLQQQLHTVEQKSADIEILKTGLDDIAKSKKGEDALMPVSDGIFVKGKIEDSANLIVNVGAGVAVEKSIEDTKLMLDKRVEELQKFKEQVQSKIDEINSQAQQVGEQVQPEG